MNCVYARLLYTGKKVVEKSYLAFKDDEVVGISSAKRGKLLGRFDTITPAFVDPHSHIGMCRSGEPADEEESNEKMDSMLPLSDALDSVQMDDTAFRDAVEGGVLYSGILPGSGNIVCGRSAVIRNFAATTNDALVARAGIKAAFGYNPMSTVKWKGKRPSTRMGALSILRGRLDEVQRKMKKAGKKEPLSAEDKVFAALLTGKDRLRTHVHKIDDIAALLRIVDEFKLKTTVEHTMDVHRPDIYRELKRRKISVTYGPIDSFAYKVELKNESWRNVRHLMESGVHFGLMTDHPVTPARQLFMQTRWFTRFGLSKQDAVELVTRKNAEILGLTRKMGTLEKGRWASFIGWNGDPFDITRYPVEVYGEGRRVFAD